MIENWKAIPGYEGLYEASTLGRIRTAEGKQLQAEDSSSEFGNSES